MDARRIASFVAALSLTAVAAVPVARSAGPPDLTGLWRLDARLSDAPPRPREGGEGGGGGHHGGGAWGGGGAGGRGMHHGSWGGGGGNGGGGGGAEGARRTVPLPEVIHITETPTLVSFEDSTGVVLQEITTLNGAPDTQAHSPGVPVIAGSWNDQALEVSRTGGRGMTMTQTYTLEGGGRTLVVQSAFTGGDGERREFKRVYERSTERSSE